MNQMTSYTQMRQSCIKYGILTGAGMGVFALSCLSIAVASASGAGPLLAAKGLFSSTGFCIMLPIWILMGAFCGYGLRKQFLMKALDISDRFPTAGYSDCVKGARIEYGCEILPRLAIGFFGLPFAVCLFNLSLPSTILGWTLSAVSLSLSLILFLVYRSLRAS